MPETISLGSRTEQNKPIKGGGCGEAETMSLTCNCVDLLRQDNTILDGQRRVIIKLITGILFLQSSRQPMGKGSGKKINYFSQKPKLYALA